MKDLKNFLTNTKTVVGGLIAAIAGATLAFEEVLLYLNNTDNVNVILYLFLLLVALFNTHKIEALSKSDNNSNKQLRAKILELEVFSLYYIYKDKSESVSDIHRRRLYDLEKERKELDVNGYIQEIIEDLIVRD